MLRMQPFDYIFRFKVKKTVDNKKRFIYNLS